MMFYQNENYFFAGNSDFQNKGIVCVALKLSAQATERSLDISTSIKEDIVVTSEEHCV